MLLLGFKTEAAFDLWSLEHLANGLAYGFLADTVVKKIFTNNSLSEAQKLFIKGCIVFAIALLWENIEHYIEAGVLTGVIGGRITYWFQGVEHWSNRLIADNLLVLLGWYIYTKQNRLALAAQIFSTVWMAFHIFIFPHSMYLQNLLTAWLTK
jgi:hypothetical protein